MCPKASASHPPATRTPGSEPQQRKNCSILLWTLKQKNSWIIEAESGLMAGVFVCVSELSDHPVLRVTKQ